MISNSFFSVVTTLLLLISSIVGSGTTAFETDKDLEGFFGEYYESRYEGLGDYRIEAETFKDVSEVVAEDNNLRKAGLEGGV